MKRNSSYKVKKLQEGGDILDLPQKKLMKEIFGKYEKPSELMNGREWGSKLMGQENYGLLADLLLDPLNIIPLSKAKYFKNIQGIDKIPLNKLQQIGNTIWGLDKLDDINDIHNIKNSSKNYKSDYTPHITPKYNLGGTININNMRKKNKKRYQTGGNINMGNLLGFLPYLNTMMTGNGDIDSLINPTTGGQSGFMGSIGNITNMNKRNYSDQAHDYLMQATSKPYDGFQKGGGVPDPTLVDILNSLNLLNSSGNYAYAGKYPKGSPSNIIGTDINKLLYNNKKPKLTKKVVDAIKLNKLDQKIINAQLPQEKTKAYLDEMSTMGKPSLSNILDYKDLYGKVKKDLKITSKEAKSVADSILEDKSFMERAAIKATIYPFLQRGGVINSTGYTPGTSSMANPMNIIPGGNITMKNTPFPVLGIPSNGVPRIMQPGQDYKFGGASHVTEFPLRLQGGNIPEYGLGDWIGKQWKGVKKTVGHWGKEIGKVANDFAVGSADMIGNTTGLWDISKNSYKTGIGQQIQGPMNNIGGMLGSAAWGSLGLSQPGMAQGMRQGNMGGQQPMGEPQPQGGGGMGDLSSLLQFIPMLMQGMNQKEQPQQSQYRYGLPYQPQQGLPYQAQQGGTIQPHGDPYEYQDNGDGTYNTRKRGSSKWTKVSKDKPYGGAYNAIQTEIYPETVVAHDYLTRGLGYKPGSKEYREEYQKVSKVPVPRDESGEADVSAWLDNVYKVENESNQQYDYKWNGGESNKKNTSSQFGYAPGMQTVGNIIPFASKEAKQAAADRAAADRLTASKENNITEQADRQYWSTPAGDRSMPYKSSTDSDYKDYSREMVTSLGVLESIALGYSMFGPGGLTAWARGSASGMDDIGKFFGKNADKVKSIIRDEWKGKINLNDISGNISRTKGVSEKISNVIKNTKKGVERAANYVEKNRPYKGNSKNSYDDFLDGFSSRAPQFHKLLGGYVKHYQQGGPVEMSPIQTEKGEMLIWPTHDITNVKATKLHKHMDEGHVTDLVPGGAGVYVASNYKPLTVKKDEVDFTLGMGRVEYDENMNRKVQPKEVNFNEVFNNKKKLTPAQIAKNISKKYGITDREDSFADRANSENKESRAPYLEILRTVNDFKREGGAPQFQQGGQVPQYQDGGMLGSIIPAILNTIMGGIQFQDNTNNRRRGERDAAEYYKLANSNLNKGTQFGTAAAVGSALSQDPYVNRPDRSIQEATIRDTLDRTPTYLRNATANQINRPLSIMKDSAFRNSTNFGRSSAAFNNSFAQTLGSQSQAALQYGNQDVGLRNQYLGNIANLKGQMAQEFANQQNQIRTNRNTIFGNLFGNVGNLGINHYNQDSALLANKYNMKAAARGQQVAANAALVQNMSNSINMVDWSKLNPQAPVQSQSTYKGYEPYVVPTPSTNPYRMPLHPLSEYPYYNDPNQTTYQ